VVLGAILFRLVYGLALRLDMPAFMLKLVSSVIVVIAISGPYLRRQVPLMIRRWQAAREGRDADA
jgi:putative ABC transport system permease protein